MPRARKPEGHFPRKAIIAFGRSGPILELPDRTPRTLAATLTSTGMCVRNQFKSNQFDSNRNQTSTLPLRYPNVTLTSTPTLVSAYECVSHAWHLVAPVWAWKRPSGQRGHIVECCGYSGSGSGNERGFRLQIWGRLNLRWRVHVRG